jgi:orotidine-5'-phosphate decarboxylase
MNNAAKKLIIALDDLSLDEALRVVEKTKAFAETYKIGLSLFCAYGPSIIREIKALGVEIFLDLKLHDIPMQVAKAVESALKFEP